jgi:hypothetical protein
MTLDNHGRAATRSRVSVDVAIHWTLRVAVAAEFFGHGAFGIMGKDGWLPYYHLFGFNDSWARTMMPVNGTVDIALGVLVLVWPMRAAVAFMAFWGLFTAFLRPLAGESIFETIERAYNYGVPLTLLLMFGLSRSPREWLVRIREIPRLTREHARRLAWVLRAVIAGMLIGHGGLGLFADKPMYLTMYESIGLTSLVEDPRTLNVVVGSFEIALGVAAFVFPVTALLAFVLAWKFSTEMLHVTMGARGAAFEVIERGGAYAAPLALILLKTAIARPDESTVAARGAPERQAS